MAECSPELFVDARASRAAARRRDEQNRAADAQLHAAAVSGNSSTTPRDRRGAEARTGCCGPDSTRPSTLKLESAWFSAIRGLAQTADARVARAGMAERPKVPGLTLAEPDFITLALELAVRGVAELAAILEEQSRRIQNPDRKARFEFVRPAFAADRSDTRRVLRASARREEPRPRAVGPRGSRVPAPSAARGVSGDDTSGQPRIAPRDSAHRRHLLPEALDGRDARRPQSACAAQMVSGFWRDVPGTIRIACAE